MNSSMQIVTPPDERARVGFFVPRWTTGPSFDCQGVPFRAIMVAGALYNAGYEIVWFDQDLEPADRLDEFSASLDGASALFIWMNELDPLTQTHNAIAIARRAKRSHPDITTIVGGEFLTVCPPETIELEPPFDYLIRGYGEDSAPELMEALSGRRPFEQVSGLVWMNGEQRHNDIVPNRKIRPESFVLYRELELTGYVQRTGGIFGNGQDTLVIGTSRGCPKRCTFCYWSTHEPSMVAAEEIVELAASLRDRYGVRQFHIAELDLATNRKRVLRMAALWREKIPDCTWFGLMSPSDAVRFTDREWDLLAEGGCRKVELGTESGSRPMLERLRKRHSPADAVSISRTLLARGIVPMHNFVFGLYGETAADRRESLRLIRQLQSIENSEWVAFTFRFYQPAWGTVMGDLAIAATPDHPKTVKELLDYRTFFGDERAHAMKWITRSDERLIKKLAFHYLPLTTSKLQFRSAARRALYRVLRATARLRLRLRFFGLGVDRWLYESLLMRRLDNTYRL